MTLDYSKQTNILFHGDSHGDWRSIFHHAQAMKDCLHIHVGDIGMGFIDPELERQQWKTINEILAENNSRFIGIRGNHDNPAFFKSDTSHYLEHIYFAPDYTYFECIGTIFLLVGGAISIDRTNREKNVSWWEDEVFVYDESKIRKADVLVTHTTPDYCSPVEYASVVHYWIVEEAKKGRVTLYNELVTERDILSKLVAAVNPRLHVYGHFHDSCNERINGRIHRLMDIYEAWSPVSI